MAATLAFLLPGGPEWFVILIVGLMLLVVITVLAVSGMNTATT